MGKGLIGRLPAAYREGSTERRCENCKYMAPRVPVLGWCSVWRDVVQGEMLCDKWKADTYGR
jgi:hypothetical protein